MFILIIDNIGSTLFPHVKPMWVLNSNTCKIFDPAEDKIKSNCNDYPTGKGVCKFKLGMQYLYTYHLEHSVCYF